MWEKNPTGTFNSASSEDRNLPVTAVGTTKLKFRAA